MAETRPDDNSMPGMETETLIVAFQGEPGSYSELAAFEHFGQGIIPLPCESFESAFEAISRLMPTTYAVELLFPTVYGVEIGDPVRAAWVLAVFALALAGLVVATYHRRMVRPA